MIKRVLFICLLTVLLSLLFCSCDSENVKQAKEAYEQQDYAAVVELLSEEKIESNDVQDMLIISEANLLYEKKEYVAAVEKLVTASTGMETEQFKEMFDTALDTSIANYDADGIIVLLGINSDAEKTVYKEITTACTNLDYDSFVLLNKIIKNLPDGKLKDDLTSYKKDNTITKAKAFLIGKWEWQEEDAEKFTTVKVVEYKDDLIGRVTKVGTLEEEYHYKKDDVYWSEFEFENSKSFLCKNLTKTTEGDPMSEMASAKIDYKDQTISIHLTGSENYNLVDPERVWKRKK